MDTKNSKHKLELDDFDGGYNQNDADFEAAKNSVSGAGAGDYEAWKDKKIICAPFKGGWSNVVQCPDVDLCHWPFILMSAPTIS